MCQYLYLHITYVSPNRWWKKIGKYLERLPGNLRSAGEKGVVLFFAMDKRGSCRMGIDMRQVGGRRHFSFARGGAEKGRRRGLASGWLSWQGSQVSIPGCERRKNPSSLRALFLALPRTTGHRVRAHGRLLTVASAFSCHCFDGTMFLGFQRNEGRKESTPVANPPPSPHELPAGLGVYRRVFNARAADVKRIPRRWLFVLMPLLAATADEALRFN